MRLLTKLLLTIKAITYTLFVVIIGLGWIVMLTWILYNLR